MPWHRQQMTTLTISMTEQLYRPIYPALKKPMFLMRRGKSEHSETRPKRKREQNATTTGLRRLAKVSPGMISKIWGRNLHRQV